MDKRLLYFSDFEHMKTQIVRLHIGSRLFYSFRLVHSFVCCYRLLKNKRENIFDYGNK